MADMISVATGFQSSVNIAYDINDEAKLKNYIPTKSALKLLEDILLSTGKESTDRARILIGAYGKGKSHIVLMILSILMKKDITLFEKLIPVIEKEKPELYQLIKNYYAGKGKILPVVISGSSNSLAQAFLLALQRTLAENELNDIMPETNYQAAVNTIQRWKGDFPDTYEQFKGLLTDDVEEFVGRLTDFDPSAYEEFEKLYPSLTAGSSFNPFIGFDVADLYEEVVKALKPKGYSGIYAIYDEFSKYLENHIADATKSDTKMLQDFAEKCGRSADNQLHLMLISHKEITSYIDRASKAMVDGWRGVSERFRHVYLNNNFTQTYEIIAAAIEKDQEQWSAFVGEHDTEFQGMKYLYSGHPLFSDTYEEGIDRVIYDCYPLHPVSTFILPRLSERVAQNERTLFTFISATGESTLSAFLKKNADNAFELATPDLIYDYFEPLLKQEVYSGNLHKYYILTSSILRKIDENQDIRSAVSEFDAVQILMQTVDDDPVLFEDYEVVYEDLRDVLRAFIEVYTRPERRGATYFYNGSLQPIARKSDLTSLLSTICSELYGLTPVINNEVINKEEPTTVATNSRNKLIAGLLRTELEPNLGLSGSGQDVSIMRSTVLNTGIVVEQDGVVRLNLQPEDELLAGMLAVIESFVINARKNDGACFADLYKELTSAEQHIGLRKGLIPIYLSVVLHEYKKGGY